MNEKLENLLAQIVEKAMEAAEKTGEFIIEQAPLLLQEFYRWHLIKNVLALIVWFIISSISIWGFVKLFKFIKKEDTAMYPVLMFFIFPFGFGFYGLYESIYNILYITIAPKLYLIEYFIK